MRKFFRVKKKDAAFPPPPENDKIAWQELVESSDSDCGVHGDGQMVSDHDELWDSTDDEAQQGEQMEQ